MATAAMTSISVTMRMMMSLYAQSFALRDKVEDVGRLIEAQHRVRELRLHGGFVTAVSVGFAGIIRGSLVIVRQAAGHR